MHASIITAAFIYASVPLPMESYNPDCGQCLWAPLYGECDNNSNSALSNAEDTPNHNIYASTAEEEGLCLIRGNAALQFQYWEVFWAFLWIMLIFCTIAMVAVYLTVRRQEKKMTRYTFTARNSTASRTAAVTHNTQSQRIRKILLLYTLALYICWGIPFTIIFVSIEVKVWPSKISFGIRAVLESIIPLCGFCNMLVYFLPKCLTHQKKYPRMWLITCYYHVLFGSSVMCMQCSSCCTRKHIIHHDQEVNDDDAIEIEEQKEEASHEKMEKEFGMNFADFNATITNSPMALENMAGAKKHECAESNIDVQINATDEM